MFTRRQLGSVVAFLLGAGAFGSATRSVAVAGASMDVADAAEAFREAMIAADRGALVRLASDALSFGHSNGLVQTKWEFIDAVVTEKEVFRSIRHKNRRSFIVGDTGIVRYTFVADILLQGEPLDVSLGVIETWGKTEAGWKLVARQGYKA